MRFVSGVVWTTIATEASLGTSLRVPESVSAAPGHAAKVCSGVLMPRRSSSAQANIPSDRARTAVPTSVRRVHRRMRAARVGGVFGRVMTVGRQH